jgi:hypothetical protein
MHALGRLGPAVSFPAKLNVNLIVGRTYRTVEALLDETILEVEA